LRLMVGQGGFDLTSTVRGKHRWQNRSYNSTPVETRHGASLHSELLNS
jgi:hypothetical protein